MKLKKLIIDNIASIEHAEVNFDDAPLRDERLFLITGETGSGKSTIIDCICLALYGNTPRLRDARKTDYSTNGRNGNNDDSLKTDDVRQLLRRGAVSADVELTFDDDLGTTYIATWHVHRAHKKLESNIMKPERTLRTDAVGTMVHLVGTKEITPYITNLIGLDMNQFFSTVVLAQGKFAQFLNSSDDEKAALLEKMTGTEVYARVGQRIFEVCRDKENERNILQQQLQGITLLSDEEKAQITQDIDIHTQQLDGINKRCEQAKAMLQWLDDKARIEKELAKSQEELASKQSIIQQQEYLEKQQLVSDWEASIEPRRELRELDSAKRGLKALQDDKASMQVEFDKLCAALRAAVDNVAAQQHKLEETKRFLSEEEPNSGMYRSIQGIKTLLKQRQAELKNITEFTKALNLDQGRKPGVETTLQDTISAQRQQEELVKGLEEEYRKLDVNGINATKDAVTLARQALVLLMANNEAITLADARLNDLKTEREKELQTLHRLQASIGDKSTIVEQACAAVERETDWNTLLVQAHKSLHQGDTCPVCGNVIQELIAPKGESVLQGLRDQLQQAQAEFNATQSSIAACDKAIKRIDGQMADCQKQIAALTATRDEQWRQAQERLSRCGRQDNQLNDNAQAQAVITALDSEIDNLNSHLLQAERLNASITTERNKLALLVQAHNKAQIDLEHVVESIKHQQEAIKRGNENIDALTRDLNALFSMPDWQELEANQPDFILQLEHKATAHQRMENDAKRLERDIDIAQSIIPAMQDNKRNIVGLVDNGETCDQVPQRLDVLWRQFENRNIDWNNQLNNLHDKAVQAQHALDLWTSSHPAIDVQRLTQLNGVEPQVIEDTKRHQRQLADLITHMQGAVSTLAKQRQEIIEMRPPHELEDREKLDEIINQSQERLKELNDHIANLKVSIKTDEANLKTVGEKKRALDKAQAVFEQWQDLKERLGDTTGAKFRRIAQSYILGELLNAANGYLRQFNDRFELEAKPGSLVILARDLLQGDLTSVNTLSGGESFMVSLALALALSSATGKMFSVDTLFIDEGFGSLSENYLDHVMETLNRLYDMGGRRVGIISHVELLKERVTTQIQVQRDPGNNTVSRVNVVQEM